MFNWSNSDKIVIPVTVLIITAIAVLLHFLLRDRKAFLRRLPLQILSVFVIIIEIAKQIYYNCFGEFTYYVLPVHFCSLIAVLMLLAQFLPKRAADIFKPMAFVYTFLVLLLVLVNPNALIGSSTENILGNFHNFHTFTFHFTLISYFILSVTLGNYVPQLKHCINVVCGILFYACYAVPVAFRLNVNYVNILYSAFQPLENFRITAGQVWYDVVLFLIAVTFACLILISAFLISRLLGKISKK